MIKRKGRQVIQFGLAAFDLPSADLPSDVQIVADVAVRVHILRIDNLKQIKINGFCVLYVVEHIIHKVLWKLLL